MATSVARPVSLWGLGAQGVVGTVPTVPCKEDRPDWHELVESARSCFQPAPQCFQIPPGLKPLAVAPQVSPYAQFAQAQEGRVSTLGQLPLDRAPLTKNGLPFNASGLTDLMRGRQFVQVGQHLIINDSVNLHVPTALLRVDLKQGGSAQPLLEADWATILQSDVDTRVVEGPHKFYWEEQKEGWCAKHALNAALGFEATTPEDFHDAARQINRDAPPVAQDGWTTMAVLAQAAKCVIRSEALHWREPCCVSASDDQKLEDAIFTAPPGSAMVLMDPERRHFLTFKNVQGEHGPNAWHKLDSLSPQVEPQSVVEYLLDKEHPNADWREFEILLLKPKTTRTHPDAKAASAA